MVMRRSSLTRKSKFNGEPAPPAQAAAKLLEGPRASHPHLTRAEILGSLSYIYLGTFVPCQWQNNAWCRDVNFLNLDLWNLGKVDFLLRKLYGCFPAHWKFRSSLLLFQQVFQRGQEESSQPDWFNGHHHSCCANSENLTILTFIFQIHLNYHSPLERPFNHR